MQIFSRKTFHLKRFMLTLHAHFMLKHSFSLANGALLFYNFIIIDLADRETVCPFREPSGFLAKGAFP